MSQTSGIYEATAVTTRQLVGIHVAFVAGWATFLAAVLLSLDLLTEGSGSLSEEELFLRAWSYVFDAQRIDYAYPPITLWVGIVMALLSVERMAVGPVMAIRTAKRGMRTLRKELSSSAEAHADREAAQNLTRQLHERGRSGLFGGGNVRKGFGLLGAGLILVTALLAPRSISEGFWLVHVTGQKGLLPWVCVVGSLIILAGLLLSFPYGPREKVVVDVLGNVRSADEPVPPPSEP